MELTHSQICRSSAAPADAAPPAGARTPVVDPARPPMFLDLVMRKGSSETAETQELTIDLHGLSRVRPLAELGEIIAEGCRRNFLRTGVRGDLMATLGFLLSWDGSQLFHSLRYYPRSGWGRARQTHTRFAILGLQKAGSSEHFAAKDLVSNLDAIRDTRFNSSFAFCCSWLTRGTS